MINIGIFIVTLYRICTTNQKMKLCTGRAGHPRRDWTMMGDGGQKGENTGEDTRDTRRKKGVFTRGFGASFAKRRKGFSRRRRATKGGGENTDKNKAKTLKRMTRIKVEIKRICEGCGNDFVAAQSVSRFCSGKCSKRAYKARLREEKIMRSGAETELRRIENR